MADKKKGWTYISLGGIMLSVVTLFLPIVEYVSSKGVEYTYNVIGFVVDYTQFVNKVLYEFTSDVMRWMDPSMASALVVLLAFVGVVAILCAFIGIISMSKQYESVWPFRLSVTGIVGTAIPAISILAMYLISRDYFLGRMRIGVYVIVTPLAMIAACIAVTYRHRLTKEQQAIEREAEKYIRIAGDL